MNLKYENLINKVLMEYKSIPKEIYLMNYEKEKYWVKKARQTKPSFGHKFFHKILNLKMIIPLGEYKCKKKALEFETLKLQKFKNLGINVPSIIFKNKDFFILEDTGKTVHSYFKNENIKKEDIYFLIKKSIEMIAKIHNKGEYHGGTQSRNLTFKNGKIYVIDLEESFSQDIPLKILQYRDILFFLLSLSKIKSRIDLDYGLIFDEYISLTGNIDFKTRLNKLPKKVYFLIKLGKFMNIFLGKDAKIFLEFFDKVFQGK